MLAVSVNDLLDAMIITEGLGVTFPVLYDPSTQVARDYEVFDLLDDDLAAPSMFIMDTEGVIRWKHIGEAAGDRPSLATIREQLAGLLSTEMVPTPEPEVVVGTDVGDLAPGFTPPSTAGMDQSLESYRGEKNVVVVFYRAFW